MSYPDSIIYELKDKLEVTKYENTEHYKITKYFIENPKKILNILCE